MPKKSREKEGNSKNLLSCWVTDVEFELIKKAIPKDESMSSFLRKIIIKEVRKLLIEKMFEVKLREVDVNDLPKTISKEKED